MRTLRHILLVAVALLTAISCEKPVVDVYDTTFSVEAAYVEASSSQPAGVTLRLHDGNPSLSFAVEYSIDNTASLHLSDTGGDITSPATLTFAADSTVTLFLPDLGPGDHTLTYRFTTPTGGKYDGSASFTVTRLSKDPEHIKAPESVSLTMGSSEVFEIEVIPSDADDKTLSVTSSNPLVATAELNLLTVGQANQKLVVSAHTVGSADIVISDASGKLSVTVPVTVAGIQATDIVLSASSLDIRKGEIASLTYSVIPENVTDHKVTATVTDTKVATAEVSGGKVVVKGVSAGSTILNVSCAGYVKSVSVTVYEISIVMPEVTSLTVGESRDVTFSALPAGSGLAVTAAVSSGSAVTLAKTATAGTYTLKAVSPGTAVITATCGGVSSQMTVTVIKAQATLSVSPVSVMSLKWGEQVTFSVVSNGQYSIEYDRTTLELVTSNSTSFIMKNINPLYTTKDVSFTVSSKDDPTVKAAVAVYAEGRPEAISVSNVSSGEGVAKYTVGGDNSGWSIVSVPSGLKQSVSGSTVTLTNDTYETITGTLKVKTDQQGVVASVEISVPGKGITVSSVTMEPSSFNVKEGASQTFTLKVTYSNGRSEDITSSADWSCSSNLTGVSGKPGSFKAEAAGSAWVSGTYGGKTAKANGTVAAAAVTSLAVTPSNEQNLKIGESLSVSLAASYDNGAKKYDILDKASWSFDNTILKMSPAGTFKALKAGTTTVKATFEGKTAQVRVTVTRALKGLAFATASYSLTAGETAAVKVTASYDDGTTEDITSKCSFSSTSFSVASVSGTRLEAKSAGNATIKASFGGFTAQAVVTVKAAVVPVQSVSLDRTSLSMTAGESATLAVSVLPEDATDRSCGWTSSNTGVATVDGNGQVIARAAGSAVITVKCGGKEATCNVTVKAKTVPVTGVTIDNSSITLTKGDTQTLTATVSPANASDRNVTWSSSDSSVATVTSAGVVKAVGAGTATITVKTSDGNKTAVCNVTVKDNVMQGIALDVVSVRMKVGETQTLKATTSPAGLAVSWFSSNAGIASVDPNGVVMAKAAGEAVIYASTPDGVTAQCGVTVENQGKVWIECLTDLNNVHCGDTVIFRAWYEHPVGGKIDITSEITLDITPYNWARKLSAGRWIVDDSQTRTYTVTSIYGYRGKYDNDAVLVFPEREFSFTTKARPHSEDYVTVSVAFTPLNGGSVIYNYSPMKFYNGESKSIATLLGNQFDGYDYSWKITVDGKTYDGTFNLNVMKGDPQDVLYQINTEKVKATVLLDYQ